MKKFNAVVSAAVLMLGGFATLASAQNYLVTPLLWVGIAEQCGVGFPAGSKIVASTWLNGIGLPDNGASHPSTNTKEVHSGFLMSKHGPTSNCSEAYAVISGWTAGAPVTALGFDVLKGGACGANAPRFTVFSGANIYFFGCVHGNTIAAPQDPANWNRVAFSAAGEPAGGYPGAEGFIWGVTPVDLMFIEFLEGTDTPTGVDNPAGVGLTVLDNIRINKTYVTKKKGNLIIP